MYEPEKYAEYHNATIDNDRPVHRFCRHLKAGRPEGKEESDDGKKDGNNVDWQSQTAESEWPPSK